MTTFTIVYWTHSLGFTKKKKNLRAQVHDESEHLFVYITIVSAGTQKADHILNNNVTNRRLPTLESNLKKKKKKKDDIQI